MEQSDHYVDIVNKATSLSYICKKLNLPTNGTGLRQARKICLSVGVSPSVIEERRKKRQVEIRTKWKTITKICPVCNKEFTTQENHKRAKTTCSHSCSNTFFRSGENNPNWKNDDSASYRKVCFRHHKKKCCVCGEKRIVEAHHIDGNHDNKSPDNFVPLCPTHHRYWHSRFKHLIEEKVQNYIKKFKEN